MATETEKFEPFEHLGHRFEVTHENGFARYYSPTQHHTGYPYDASLCPRFATRADAELWAEEMVYFASLVD